MDAEQDKVVEKALSGSFHTNYCLHYQNVHNRDASTIQIIKIGDGLRIRLCTFMYFLSARIEREDGVIVRDVCSGMIVPEGAPVVDLWIFWEVPSFLAICVGDIIVASTEIIRDGRRHERLQVHEIDGGYRIGERIYKRQNNPLDHYKSANVLASKARVKSLKDARSSGKIISSEDRFTALRDEREQAVFFFEEIKKGRNLYSSLARAIRSMIDKRRNNKPLLQTCAAIIKADLICYTSTDAGAKFEGGRHSFINIYSEPNYFSNIPIDIDVWLDQDCGIILDKKFTNQEFLQMYADKVASHYDYEKPAEVRYFEEVSIFVKFDEKIIELNRVQRWLVLVADVFLKLSQHLLEIYDEKASSR